jgi:endonuclease/exonuclease/phosphatase (EEP) superfamily protein YafD
MQATSAELAEISFTEIIKQLKINMVWTEKLAAIALGLLMLLVAVAVGSSVWGFTFLTERFAHFQIQYWLGSLFLLGLMAITKNKTLFLAGLVCVALISANLLTWYTPTNRQSMPLLKVLSSNTWAYNQNYPMLLELIRKENPDIAMFYEVTAPGQQQLDTLNDILPFSIGRNTEALVYTKLSLDGTRMIVNNPRFFNTTIIENLRKGDKSFTLIATHPSSPHNKERFLARNQQLENLADYLSSSSAPVIMGGDFNVSMWSPFYRHFVDIARLTNAREGFGVIPTWTPARIRSLPEFLQPWLSIPIDYIFTRSGKFELRTISMKAGSYVGSDHLPVIAEIGVADQ